MRSHVFLLWLLKPDGSIRDLIMSEFSKGVVLESEQLYRGNRKYFRFDLRSSGYFQALLVQQLSQLLIEVGDTELRPSCSPFSATCDHFRSRFRKDRNECKRGNALIGPAIGRKFFSYRSKYKKEYSDT